MGILGNLDISKGIDRARYATMRQRTALAALIKASANVIKAFVFFVLAWIFDFDSTFDFFVPGIGSLLTSTGQPPWLLYVIPSFFVLLSLTNTLIQLFAPDLAEEGIGLIAFLIYMTIAFDAWTDYPRVQVFLSFYEPEGGWEWILWLAMHPILLFVATIMLEFAAVVFAATAVFSFVWSLKLAIAASFTRRVRYDE